MTSGMRREDLVTYSKMGSALWADLAVSESITAETLAAASLLRLTPERVLERAVIGLLENARQRNFWKVSSAHRFDLQSFFRLSIEERLALIAVHIGDWSYAKVSRILNLNPDVFAGFLWNARLKLSLGDESGPVVYPAGPIEQRLQCPEYDPSAPWTQRFLDEEIETQQGRFYLQNHLMACVSCREALARCRKVYYKVDHEILRLTQGVDFSKRLEKVLDLSPVAKSPLDRTFKESLEIFLQKKDIQLISSVFLVSLVVWVLKVWVF